MNKRNNQDFQSSQRLDSYEGEQAEEVPSKIKVSILERLKSDPIDGSPMDEDSDEDEGYKPFNIMRHSRTHRESKIGAEKRITPRNLPHAEIKIKYNDHGRRKDSSSAKLRDIQRMKTFHKSPQRISLINTEDSKTEDFEKLKEELFKYKNENTALKRNIDILENQLVDVKEEQDVKQDNVLNNEIENLRKDLKFATNRLSYYESKKCELGKHANNHPINLGLEGSIQHLIVALEHAEKFIVLKTREMETKEKYFEKAIIKTEEEYNSKDQSYSQKIVFLKRVILDLREAYDNQKVL
jgi:hypothetical protein